MWATDEELSGVAKVEAAFNPSGSGKFGGTTTPVPLERDATGRWFAKLPTKSLPPGEITLLVQATDRVDNVSDYTKFKCHVATPDEMSAINAAKLAHIAGTVLFGPGPAPQIQVTLTGDKTDKGPAPKFARRRRPTTMAILRSATFRPASTSWRPKA